MAKWEFFSENQFKKIRDEEELLIAKKLAETGFADTHLGKNWLINN
jgi:hypothetical protein